MQKTIKLTVSVLVPPVIHAPGDVVTIDESRAMVLIDLGHAIPYVPEIETATINRPRRNAAKLTGKAD